MRGQDIQRVGVVGAGTMGAAIAQHFLMKGLRVDLVDLNENSIARGRKLIEESLQEAVARKVMTADQRELALGNLATATALSSLRECSLVVEAVFENFKVKQDLFIELEKVLPQETLLATNTSSYSVTDLAEGLKNPKRFLGVHYFYHAAKNKLVEIVAGHKSDPLMVERVRDFYLYYDKLPIVVGDGPGFAVNRFFVPWLNEAVRLYEEGAGSVAAIDRCACDLFKIGMGPFALMNATGVAIAYHAAQGLSEKLGPFYAAASLLQKQSSLGPWDLNLPSKGLENLNLIRERLLGAALGVAAQMVSEGVASASDCDLGARVGLRWAKGPFEMMSELSLREISAMVTKLFSRWDLRLPTYFETPSKWPLEWLKSFQIKDLGFICFNRPDSMNALNESVMQELEQKFLALENNREIKKIFFMGVGKAFVAGADIKFFIDHIDRGTFDKIQKFTEFGQSVLNRISNSQKTCVAYLDGLTLGGGLELALACHYRLATSRALLAFPETGIGIYPGLGGTQRLPRLVGKGIAKFLIATGKMISAKVALGYGLVDQIVERTTVFSELDCIQLNHPKRPQGLVEEGFDSFKGELSSDLLAREPFLTHAKALQSRAPLALKKAMSLIDEGESVELEKALKLELRDLGWVFGTKDARIGLGSVIDRSRPQYLGK